MSLWPTCKAVEANYHRFVDGQCPRRVPVFQNWLTQRQDELGPFELGGTSNQLCSFSRRHRKKIGNSHSQVSEKKKIIASVHIKSGYRRVYLDVVQTRCAQSIHQAGKPDNKFNRLYTSIAWYTLKESPVIETRAFHRIGYALITARSK